MPAELNEILDEWRNASGPHIVQGSELRRMAAELDARTADLDRLRDRITKGGALSILTSWLEENGYDGTELLIRLGVSGELSSDGR